MVMMALLPPGGLLGGYGADPDGVNGSWEEACTCVSTSIRVRVAVAAGEYPRHLPQRLFLACPRPASMACALHSTVLFVHGRKISCNRVHSGHEETPEELTNVHIDV